MARMAASQLKNICETKLTNAVGWMGGVVPNERMLAVSYYRGDQFGNEQDGRSKVVSRDVAEAIDSAMPSLIKIFASADQVVVFNPRRPEDEEAAAQATDYINWLFQTLPNAFDLLQTWIKSGLLSKLGVVKAYWDDTHEFTTEDYEGLTPVQVKTLLSDDDVEMLSSEPEMPEEPPLDPNAPQSTQTPVAATQAPGTPPGMASPVPGAPPPGRPVPGMGSSITSPMPGLEPTYAIKIKRIHRRGKICVDALPPEEFLTEKRATTLDKDKCFFAAHRCRRTVSDLIEMGYDRKIVENLPGADDLEFNSERTNRFWPEDDNPQTDDGVLDPSMRYVWAAECFLKVDYDGDGVAEWRKTMMAGGGALDILDNEDADGHPFVAWTPYKSPHKLIGESMADKTMDLQLIKSTVWRQILDGMYFNNAPQLVVQEGQANMEDVLTRRPGGVIRVRTQGAVTPLPVQDSSASGFQMISYLDSIRETRTGIRRFTAGLNEDALNPYASTATGANLVEDASQDAIMLIARNFAEMGLKQLFKRMLELTCKYQDKAQTIRLRGKWVNIDPSAWNTEMDMTVTVGLGTGNRDRQVGQLIQLMTQIDVPLAQAQGGLKGPILTMENVYAKVKKLTEAMGYKEADNLYTDPANAPPQPPEPQQPDPKLAVEQMKGQNALQVQQAKAAADAQNQQHRVQADAAIESIKAQAAQEKAERDAQLKEWMAMQQHARESESAQMKHILDFVAKVHGAELQAHTAKAVAAAKPNGASA